MTLRFDDEVALVTGAESGLGRAYALLLAARGATVAVNGLGDGVDAVVEAIRSAGGKAIPARGDVRHEAATIVAAAAAGGRLDMVINNAGISGGGHFMTTSEAEVDRLLETHLKGTIAISRAAWPLLVASGNGRLLQTSSSSTFGAAYTSYYGAAKGGIFVLVRAWAEEAATSREPVRVMGIMPSAYSAMTKQIPDPAMVQMIQDHFQPERVASFVSWLLHRDTTISGETFQVGANRAARVLLAEGKGAMGTEDPDSWAGREAEVLSLDGLASPTSMINEVVFQVESIGGEVAASFAKVDPGKNWSEL